MIDLVGCGEAHTCAGGTRRDFLKVGTLGVVGLSLPQYLAAKEAGRVNPDKDDRACIMIFNLGAPSQLDTWDMKPDAPVEVRGPFQPIETTVPGIQVSEILPRHAGIADKFSLVRSCHHMGAAVHDAGWQIVQTGRAFRGGVETPHAGAVLSYLRGRKSDLPPTVVLPEKMGAGGGNLPNGQAGGFLARRTIRSHWTPILPNPNSKSPICCHRPKSAPHGLTAGGGCEKSSKVPSRISRPTRVPSC